MSGASDSLQAKLGQLYDEATPDERELLFGILSLAASATQGGSEVEGFASTNTWLGASQLAGLKIQTADSSASAVMATLEDILSKQQQTADAVVKNMRS